MDQNAKLWWEEMSKKQPFEYPMYLPDSRGRVVGAALSKQITLHGFQPVSKDHSPTIFSRLLETTQEIGPSVGYDQVASLWSSPSETSLSTQWPLWVTKWVTGWLPVAKTMHWWKQSETSWCPSCCMQIEDSDHIVTCPEAEWLEKLQNAITVLESQLLAAKVPSPVTNMVLTILFSEHYSLQEWPDKLVALQSQHCVLPNMFLRIQTQALSTYGLLASQPQWDIWWWLVLILENNGVVLHGMCGITAMGWFMKIQFKPTIW